MILIDKDQHYKALQPLLKVSVNHLFARSVVERHVEGSIYADKLPDPTVFYVVHPYGMSLLFGETADCNFYNDVTDYMLNRSHQRQNVEWMQVWPGAWNEIIYSFLRKEMVGPDEAENNPLIEVHTRANFKFNKSKYREIRKGINSSGLSIVRTNSYHYERMDGLVVPKKFWNQTDDFLKRGVGFTLTDHDEPACTAYSAYIFDHQLELGIETMQGHRRKGYAIHTCCALIDYCLLNNYEPVWSCRLQNTASYRLAQALGFEPTFTLPYYRLPV
jgi:hypothetical protein